MKRLNVPELEDLPWFPRALRQWMTDCLRMFNRLFSPYGVVDKKLEEALKCTGAKKIVDLCSGSGGPLLLLWHDLREGAGIENIILTDLFPARALPPLQEGVSYFPHPVDARDVPEALHGGLRTLFTAFHHFAPHDALKVLEDACNHREGIAVFEVTQRSFMGVMVVLATPFITLLASPFIKPFSWRRLVFTYLVPVVPICILWDGVASTLKSYTIDELRQFGEVFPTYRWEVGSLQGVLKIKINYLIGIPPMTEESSAQAAP